MGRFADQMDCPGYIPYYNYPVRFADTTDNLTNVLNYRHSDYSATDRPQWTVCDVRDGYRLGTDGEAATDGQLRLEKSSRGTRSG